MSARLRCDHPPCGAFGPSDAEMAHALCVLCSVGRYQLSSFRDEPTRPSRDECWLRTAEVWALRATCDRLAVGAVVTDRDRLVSRGIGYNGNAAGLANGCDDAATPGACGCLHAELNALLKSGRVPGGVLYATTAPCLACAKAIVNAALARVVYRRAYRLADGVALLTAARVRVEQLP